MDKIAVMIDLGQLGHVFAAGLVEAVDADPAHGCAGRIAAARGSR